MIFDFFHSLGRVDSLAKKVTDGQVFAQFFRQTKLAEILGFHMVWVAESHFSSEVQKTHREPVIPHYQGEVGLNTDSFQLFHLVRQMTKKIGFGTAITNIVGGNGGPIAVADRVRMLAWSQAVLDPEAGRRLAIGIASGRFPYINRPFGIVPRDKIEAFIWPTIQRFIFLEAMEIFLRLSRGHIIGSCDLNKHWLNRGMFSEEQWESISFLAKNDKSYEISENAIRYRPRWDFESMALVPELLPSELEKMTTFVLGSHDPLARIHGLKFSDLDIFNLSFTPPAEIDKTHSEMARLIETYQESPQVPLESMVTHDKLTVKTVIDNVRYRPWHRSRMPRTVLIFIDKDPKKARLMAENALEVYRGAMAGTVRLPPQSDLLARALVGSPLEIVEQLREGAPHGFHADDRLMLWFEFNQSDGDLILSQMRLFAEEVMPHFV